MPTGTNLPVEVSERLKILKTILGMIHDMDVDLIHMPFFTTEPLRAYLLTPHQKPSDSGCWDRPRPDVIYRSGVNEVWH